MHRRRGLRYGTEVPVRGTPGSQSHTHDSRELKLHSTQHSQESKPHSTQHSCESKPHSTQHSRELKPHSTQHSRELKAKSTPGLPGAITILGSPGPKTTLALSPAYLGVKARLKPSHFDDDKRWNNRGNENQQHTCYSIRENNPYYLFRHNSLLLLVQLLPPFFSPPSWLWYHYLFIRS